MSNRSKNKSKMSTIAISFFNNVLMSSFSHFQILFQPTTLQTGNGTCGTDVRVRNHKLHCQNCYSNDEGPF